MISHMESIAHIPLPVFHQYNELPQSIGMRQFGITENDLGINFNSANKAELVTRLLETCVIDPENFLPDNFFLDLNIGKRIECLLMLAAGTSKTTFGFPFQCSNCGVEIEFDLSLTEISEMQGVADLKTTAAASICNRWMKFRKPTGRDQERWSREHFNDDIALEMIRTLVEPTELLDRLAPEDLDAIEQVLDEIDPLVYFSCTVNCTECGIQVDREIDLMETALGLLNRAQNQLVIMVHRLASHYNWNEEEIFNVPGWRRQHYLELIGAIRK